MKGPILKTLISQLLFKTGLLLDREGVSPCVIAKGDFFLAVRLTPLFLGPGCLS